MAEVFGVVASAITLAELFKICIEAFEFVRHAKNQEVELQKLSLKLNIEKCRLFVWGQSMGLTDKNKSTQNLLNDFPFQHLVRDALQLIIQLLTNSQDLGRKYGCRKSEYAVQDVGLLDCDAATPASRLNAAFDNFKNGRSIQNMAKQAKSTTRWVIHDRKRFTLLIKEAKDLIDGVQDMTKNLASKRQQERVMTSRIITIHDQETLSMISEVCDSDHPAFSDAASCRHDALSMAPSRQQEVSNWIDHTEPENAQLHLTESMEEWTLAEYRRNFLDLLGERGTNWQPPPPVFPCYDCGLNLPTQREWEQHMAREEAHCSFCHTTFECHGLLMQHGCFSRRKRHEVIVNDETEHVQEDVSISNDTLPGGRHVANSGQSMPPAPIQEGNDAKAQYYLLRNRQAT
jgi:Prion-inhibition and propagation